MNDVFLSYAREDRPFATRLVNALAGLGINVWWDYRIAPGEDFARRTEDELERSKAVLVIWSSHSVESTWVQNEVRRGVERTRVIIPVLIEQVALPLEFSNLEAISLIDWSGDPTHDGFCNVVVAIPSAHRSSIPPAPPRTIVQQRRRQVGFASVAGVAAIVVGFVLGPRIWRILLPPPPAPDVGLVAPATNPVYPDADARVPEPPASNVTPVITPDPSVSPPQPKPPGTPVAPAERCCDDNGSRTPCAKAHCACPGLKRCP